MAASTDAEIGGVEEEQIRLSPEPTKRAEAARAVNWEGDNDPENPMHWSKGKKAINVCIVGFLTFLPPLDSSTIAPGVPRLAQEFDEIRKPVMALVVSIFVLGFAFGPLLLAPLSELYGRRIIYNITNVGFLAFNLGCALAPGITPFIIFRFLAGAFGGSAMSICGGSVADMIPLAKRGALMSLILSGAFVGPVLGPIIGGFISQGPGWRWVMWLQTILCGIMTVVTFFFLSESHGPTILRRKAKRLGKDHLEVVEKPTVNAKTVLFRAIFRPMRMLIRSPIVAFLSLYLALIYGYLYLLFTTFATVYPRVYGFSTGVSGLAYLGLGVGLGLALAVLSWFSDWMQEKLTKKHGVSKPEYRLVPLIVSIPFLPIGLFVYGWTVQYKVHWIVPIIFTAFTGVGLIFSYIPTQIYMVDAFTKYAASALAAAGVVRSLFGACLPLAGESMYSALGYGWGNSLLGFIAILVSVAPFLFWKYGERLRTGKFEVSFD